MLGAADGNTLFGLADIEDLAFARALGVYDPEVNRWVEILAKPFPWA